MHLQQRIHKPILQPQRRVRTTSNLTPNTRIPFPHTHTHTPLLTLLPPHLAQLALMLRQRLLLVLLALSPRFAISATGAGSIAVPLPPGVRLQHIGRVNREDGVCELLGAEIPDEGGAGACEQRLGAHGAVGGHVGDGG